MRTLRRLAAVTAAASLLITSPGAAAAGGLFFKAGSARRMPGRAVAAPAFRLSAPAQGFLFNEVPGTGPAAVSADAASPSARPDRTDLPLPERSPEAALARVGAHPSVRAMLARDGDVPAASRAAFDEGVARARTGDSVAAGPSVHGDARSGLAASRRGASRAAAPTVPARAPLLPSDRRVPGALRRNAVAVGAVTAAGLAVSGLAYAAVGLTFPAGVAVPLVLTALHNLLSRLGPGAALREQVASARRAGAVPATEEAAPGLLAEVAGLAAAAGVPMPRVMLADLPAGTRAVTLGQPSLRTSVLIVGRAHLGDPERRAFLAHELQHAKDLPGAWSMTPGHSVRSAALAALLAAGVLAWTAAAAVAPVPPPSVDLLPAAFAALAFPLTLGLRGLQRYLLEMRADLGGARLVGSAAMERLLSGLRSPRAWARGASALAGSGAAFDFPARGGAAGPNPDQPEYYAAVPEWASRLRPADDAFKTDAEREAYQAELARLRPLARWMAHFYSVLRDEDVQRAPNILTLQDLLDWASYVRKYESQPGKWKGSPWDVKRAVREGVSFVFKSTLPSAEYEGRFLRREVETRLNELSPLLDRIGVPDHLAAPTPKDDPKDAGAGKVEFLQDQPTLFQAGQVEALRGPNYVLTPTVTERLEDLVQMYSTNHKLKFWPLLMGDSGEGKSSLVRHMFSLPWLKEALGRAVPVVSLPVKEAMTRRELLGGKGPRGVELGFLSNAAQNGWVLVLEELNQASPEFKKSLNDVLHQIRQQGYFEFEVGGQTVRVKAHPHFWVVGTQNPDEGNYAITRNPDSPDFLKRWKVRYFTNFPPAEQADIMRGLAVKMMGEADADRHGLTTTLFEQIVTQFHQPVRELVLNGRLGGDAQEPYEYNRRTLLRFLQRYVADLLYYEAQGRRIDDRVRRLLMARELMEAYGAEIRKTGEKEALWDQLNAVFALEADHKIGLKDDPDKGLTGVSIKVNGFYREGGRLVMDEALVPVALPLRENGGSRVPGPEHRLTMVPSLAENLYRGLRNRQFGVNQMATGPTGTAKTSSVYFMTHMLGEPLFPITLDEQTPLSEFHGGFVKDPATGEFRFLPGILARAMMYDPEGVLKEGALPSAADVRADRRIGATFLVNEGNASPILESINPALDDGVLNLSDGQSTAVAGASFHVAITMNPVGEGYAGFPLTGALRSRTQIVEYPGALGEEELAELLLDKLTGVTRHLIGAPGK